jgi:hypothetical protein
MIVFIHSIVLETRTRFTEGVVGEASRLTLSGWLPTEEGKAGRLTYDTPLRCLFQRRLGGGEACHRDPERAAADV